MQEDEEEWKALKADNLQIEELARALEADMKELFGPLTRAHAKMESELLRITERRTRLQGRALALPPGPERAKCLQLHRRESRKLRDQLARIRAELGLPPE